MKRNINIYKVAGALLVSLIFVSLAANTMERDHNYYKEELRKLEESTARIHTEVDRILKKFRDNMKEYYHRTRGIPKVGAVPVHYHYQDTVRNTIWPFKPMDNKICLEYLEKFKKADYIEDFTRDEYPKISKAYILSHYDINKARIDAAKKEAGTTPPTKEQIQRWGKIQDSPGSDISYKTVGNVVINHQGNMLIAKDPDAHNKIKGILEKTIIYSKPEEINVRKDSKPAKIEIVPGDLISQAQQQHRNGAKKIGMVVASDRFNVGGGHTDGAGAMEEKFIFSMPYLSPVLGIVAEGHGYPLPEDGAMVVDGAQIMRSPGSYQYLSSSEMFPITLIFSAAPDLRHSGNFSLSDTAAYKKNLKDKLETQIMSAAKAGCKTLLLGAWGCGVFKNTPENIAEAYVEVLKLYQGHFEKIVVVIYNGERDQNWAPFKDAFLQLQN